MTAPLHERPARPLTPVERARFADLAVLASPRPWRTTRYHTAAWRLRLLIRRVRCSAFAADLRDYGWLAGLLAAGVLCLIVTRGSQVTWHGLETIPTGGVR